MARKKKKNEEEIIELSDLLRNIPDEELGTLRIYMSNYQTAHDWLEWRNKIDAKIDELHNKYGSEIHKFLVEGLRRVIEHSGRYVTLDICDNCSICKEKSNPKFCYDFDCKYYIPSIKR